MLFRMNGDLACCWFKFCQHSNDLCTEAVCHCCILFSCCSGLFVCICGDIAIAFSRLQRRVFDKSFHANSNEWCVQLGFVTRRDFNACCKCETVYFFAWWFFDCASWLCKQKIQKFTWFCYRSVLGRVHIDTSMSMGFLARSKLCTTLCL